jgi:hypothetical protein
MTGLNERGIVAPEMEERIDHLAVTEDVDAPPGIIVIGNVAKGEELETAEEWALSPAGALREEIELAPPIAEHGKDKARLGRLPAAEDDGVGSADH